MKPKNLELTTKSPLGQTKLIWSMETGVVWSACIYWFGLIDQKCIFTHFSDDGVDLLICLTWGGVS